MVKIRSGARIRLARNVTTGSHYGRKYMEGSQCQRAYRPSHSSFDPSWEYMTMVFSLEKVILGAGPTFDKTREQPV